MKSKADKAIKLPPLEEKQTKSKHIVFDDDDNEDEITTIETEQLGKQSSEPTVTEKKAKKDKSSKKSEKNRKDAIEIGTMWYQVVCFNR